jgi:hypothetical protein
MRKLILIMLASLLLVPAAALAERVSAGDGSLVVSNASGRLTLSGHGLIYGHIDKGAITIVGDYKPDDNTSLSSVTGAKIRLTGKNVVYTGTNLRFFFPGGQYSLIVDGTGIDLSAVGNGKLVAIGAGTADDGTYAADSAKAQSIDSDSVSFGASFGKSSSGKGKRSDS